MQIKMKVSRKGIRPIAVATVAFMVVAVQMQSNNPTIATIALIPFSKMLYSLTIIFCYTPQRSSPVGRVCILYS